MWEAFARFFPAQNAQKEEEEEEEEED